MDRACSIVVTGLAWSLVASGFLLPLGISRAEPPRDPAVRAELIGNPQSLVVRPAAVVLREARDSCQLQVTGRYADGSTRELTCLCEFRSQTTDRLQVTRGGLVTPEQQGTGELLVRAGGLEVRVPVQVESSNFDKPVSFRREVMPILSAAGCSDIRCHGAPSGKHGFRLSLWGADPDLDYRQLTRAEFGRRTNAQDPGQSLMLLKALGRVAHVGGKRLRRDEPFSKVLRLWQRQGLRDDPHATPPTRLEVLAGQRVLRAPLRWKQLAVEARFAADDVRDVTQRTTFASISPEVASVSRTGLVEFKQQGEVVILCRFLGRLEAVRLIYLAPPPPDYRWSDPPVHNEIDRRVFAKLKLLHLTPAALCSDAEFVRRLHLDLCGTLPPPATTRAFVSSSAADKRIRLIDHLLQRPEFGQLWTKRWLDVLRVSRDSIQLAGAQAFQSWFQQRIQADVSFAQLARELLTSQGESYRDAAVNFYCVAPTPQEIKDPLYLQKDLAEATAQLFLGVRLQCAQCHNHPYERWTQEDYLGLAACFNQVQRKRLGKPGPKGRPDRRQLAVSIDLGAQELQDETGGRLVPRLPGIAAARPPAGTDRRRWLADWLTRDDNRFFARAVVNRVWFHLHGRGIVDPVDDFRDSNPAANERLLDWLAERFVADGYRLKPLIRTIVASRTYQLSSRPEPNQPQGQRYFAHQFARPLPAEVLLDAICEVSGVPEHYEITKDYISGVPSGTVQLPVGTRAVELPVTDIRTLINTSGKYVRYELHPFLRTFGQPARIQTCECDRVQAFDRKQALEMIVGSLVAKKLSQPDNRLGQLLAGDAQPREILNELYLRAVARPPDPRTTSTVLAYVAAADNPREAWEDVLWTVLNSREFLFQQ